MRTRWKVVASAALSLSLLAAAAAGPVTATATKGKVPKKPSRVLIIVLDQMLPEYVKRFDMRNVRSLMRSGVNFPRAIVGHMAATTVITHNVLTSGQLPKHMGWTNEVYRDTDNVLS